MISSFALQSNRRIRGHFPSILSSVRLFFDTAGQGSDNFKPIAETSQSIHFSCNRRFVSLYHAPFSESLKRRLGELCVFVSSRKAYQTCGTSGKSHHEAAQSAGLRERFASLILFCCQHFTGLELIFLIDFNFSLAGHAELLSQLTQVGPVSQVRCLFVFSSGMASNMRDRRCTNPDLMRSKNLKGLIGLL